MTETNTTSLEARQEKKSNIYILPPFTERDLQNIKILIQTDGNNRAKGVNQGYEHGGKTSSPSRNTLPSAGTFPK